MPQQRESSIAFIGGGPRTLGILERLAKNSGTSSGPLDIHVVDPFEPGSGRIWRRGQSALLKLNSLAGEVTMFTDSSVQMAGPPAPGPSLAEWAAGIREGRIRELPDWSPELADEAASLSPQSFPSRVLHARYLQWCYAGVLRAMPPEVTVHWHRCRAEAVEPVAGDRHRVRLSSGFAPLTVDAVVLATGHAEETGTDSGFAEFAREHGLHYQPPSYTADSDFSRVAPGREVIVRGMGLAFIDLMVLMMEGRGGRFEQTSEGLRYRPSGAEPVLLVGSGRGVPYRCKPRPQLHGSPAAVRYLTESTVRGLLETHREVDFEQHLQPLLLRELAHGYYQELATGHPHRITVGWPEFQAAVDRDAPADELRKMLADPADLLDFARLDRPLDGLSDPDRQTQISRHVAADLRLRTAEGHSESYGLFLALIGCHRAISAIPQDRFSAASRPAMAGRWHSFFSYLASGPPPARLRELLALHEAGLIRFLGAGLRVWPDPGNGRFAAAGSAGSASAEILIDAFLPVQPEPVPVDRQARMLGPDGRPIPGRFAAGPFTSAPKTGAFSRPGSNAPAFRENDALAHRLLAWIGARTPVLAEAVH
ncbi:MAG: FAD/NAD(P)-binding protein [Renibacterium sp.]|nr:FAD/NAD(P)-binding protein [Renibacterium sp.]